MRPLALLLLLLAAPAPAIELGAPFGDQMLIQRDQPIPVWGTAARGEQVTVRFAGATATTRAGKDGVWQALLPAQAASATAHTLEARGEGGGTASARDVLVGDLFLCSGQSNMAMRVGEALNGASIASAANDPLLRLATVPEAANARPQSRFPQPIRWGAAEPERVRHTSAACYATLKALRQDSSVPMGAIVAAWGGTRLSTWLSPEGARLAGDRGADLLALYGRDEAAAAAAFAPQWEGWWRARAGDAPGAEPWNAPDRLAWKPVPGPGPWEQWGDAELAAWNGLVWFRRTVELTADDLAGDARLKLAVLDDMDQTWVNGVAVGNSFGWSVQRNYRLPRAVLKPGVNEIIIAIHDSWGQGGMHGPAEMLRLDTAARSIPLGDGWRYSNPKISEGPPRSPWDSHAGTGMAWNAMLAPMGQTRLAGMLWYQGESDVGVPGYQQRLAALIAGQRQQALMPDLPFLVVQLPGFGAPPIAPSASGWADLREAQRQFVLSDPASALAVTIDLGDRTDIHPANKTLVGERLARAWRALHAGDRLGGSGPYPLAATRDGADLRLRLGGVTGLMHSWSGAHGIGIELCDAQARCRPALARPEGDSLRIAGDGAPVASIRHAWADAPVVNLFDDAPLPLIPFSVPLP